MTTRRLGAISECDARTQGAFVAALRARLRTTQRAAERGQAAECFILLELLTPAVPRLELYDELAVERLGDAQQRIDTRRPSAPFKPSDRRLSGSGDLGELAL